MSRLARIFGAPLRAWRGSLAFRFVVSALAIQLVLMSVSGWWLIQYTVAGLESGGHGDAGIVRDLLGPAVSVRIVGVLLVSSIAMYAISRQVVRPLAAGRRTAEALTSGDLTARMSETGPTDTAALARALNNMAEELSGRLQELQDMALAQQQFVSDVAHELRTPLTTVRMAADVIYDSRDEFSPVSARSAELLSREVDRFEALLHDLLDLSRMDAGAAVLAIEEVDLSQVVTSEVAAHRSLADNYHSELVVDVPDRCFARVDPMRIRAILVNLVTNAIEHGEGRPVEIRLREAGGVVALVVRDHGMGLSDAEQDQVFTRFWRADPSRLRTVGGTGLGLAIVQENAQLHGGSVDVWGRPGEGAQFRVLLPINPGQPMVGEPWPHVPPDVDLSPGAN